jgi:hypothetical protein
MAKRAKRKAAKKKSRTAKKSAKKSTKTAKSRSKRPVSKKAKRTKTKKKRTKAKNSSVKRRSNSKSRSAGAKRVPASPSGMIGQSRPSNQPKPPGKSKPRELAQAEPDARFDDPRNPEANAREHPEGSMPPMERKAGYRNTDEQF